MDDATYRRSLDVAAACVAAGPVAELNLAGIGESTLHPEFVRNVMWAREAVGWDVDLILATNGIKMNRDLAKAIAPARPRVWVSLHRPERAGLAVEVLKEFGILSGVSADPSIAAVDWAGQVPWYVSAQTKPCEYLARGWSAVRQDGSVNTCCMDAEGLYPIGHVSQAVGTMTTRTTKLCESCHLAAPLEFRVGEQWPEIVLQEIEKQRLLPQPVKQEA